MGRGAAKKTPEKIPKESARKEVEGEWEGRGNLNEEISSIARLASQPGGVLPPKAKKRDGKERKGKGEHSST